MLDMKYVENLIKRHKKKAVEHIEQLKTKIENKEAEETGWVSANDIATYWSHPEVTYLPLQTLDLIDFNLKRVRAKDFYENLEEILNIDDEQLKVLYFNFYQLNRRETATIQIGCDVSDEFLERVFRR
jgi:hypothetical protein